MNPKPADNELQKYITTYVKSKQGQITSVDREVFMITYPNNDFRQQYTYQLTASREKNVPLLTLGSPYFQQMLKECLKKGTLCQIQVQPKDNIENLVKKIYKDSDYKCQTCHKIAEDREVTNVCIKPYLCYHRINNSKIASINTTRPESLRYFLFFFLASFQNKLRPKNEDIIPILIDEKNSVVYDEFNVETLLQDEALDIQDCKSKIKSIVFRNIKVIAEKKLNFIIKEKVELYDLSIITQKKTKMKMFTDRLRRERRELVISKTHQFDYTKWQNDYEELIKKEEETYTTNISVKLLNLLVINTSKVKFEITLQNNATISSNLILGVQHSCEITCPLCHKAFTEGYATTDGLYVCSTCIRQSIDTGKIYSKKNALSLDETLKEYLEHESGFICSVCGKKHSHLLEFKCNHDNSSICIYHYDICDVCGKIFSKLNLTYTGEFQQKLCPKHTRQKGN